MHCNGVVWCGMVWYGVVWCSVVWTGCGVQWRTPNTQIVADIQLPKCQMNHTVYNGIILHNFFILQLDFVIVYTNVIALKCINYSWKVACKLKRSYQRCFHIAMKSAHLFQCAVLNTRGLGWC